MVINFEFSLVHMVGLHFFNSFRYIVSLDVFGIINKTLSAAYHTKCIDPWLTRNRRVCPVCKRRVIARGENLTDSDSETEDETRPLLRPGSYGTSGGTFTDQTVTFSNYAVFLKLCTLRHFYLLF